MKDESVEEGEDEQIQEDKQQDWGGLIWKAFMVKMQFKEFLGGAGC